MLIFQEEPGQGLAEYALLLLFIALVVVIILGIYGSSVANYYSRVTNQMP